MAKLYGLFGSMTGKLADTVMVVRNGVQMARKYQPIVANPSTQAQTEARAKLKLMSQLSAVMGPVIAMPRQGMVSPRNLFTKRNYQALGYSAGEATVDLGSVKITSSVVSMPRISASRQTENIEVGILSSDRPSANLFNRVVYVAFSRAQDGSLRLHDSIVVTEAGTGNAWKGNIALTDGELFVYAYGVRDNTETASVIFGNLAVESATAVASLIVTRQLTETDVTLTETVYYHLVAAA